MVTVTSEEIKQCYHFAVTAWRNRSQSVQQFGTDHPRMKEAFLADQISGKLAELIFKKEIEQRHPRVEVQLDFEHYLNPLHTDNGDVSIVDNGLVVPYRIDVKGSSYVAQWLLVERHKFWDLKTKAPMADRYVMIKFSNEMPTSSELRANPDRILSLEQVSGEIIGWANHTDFISSTDNAPWFSYEKGERLISPQFLPKTASYPNDIRHLTNYINKVQQSKQATSIHIGPPLDATLNFGLPIKWLNKDLGALLNRVVVH